jgi:hypothetical protein
MVEKLKRNKQFILESKAWKNNVEEVRQSYFLDVSSKSKFILAPRGYGRSSFRLYEAYKFGAVPVYIYDDFPLLPYKEFINWNDIAIIINIKDIEKLPGILEKTNATAMLENYEKVKYWFTMEGLTRYIDDRILEFCVSK